MSAQRLVFRNGFVVSMDPDIGEIPNGDVLVEEADRPRVRAQVAGDHYLPAYIRADDVVRLKDDSHVHVRVTAQYSGYKAKP